VCDAAVPYCHVTVTVLTYSASTPVGMMSRFIVDSCEAGGHLPGYAAWEIHPVMALHVDQ
jgi:hypothetical protein